MDSYDKSITIVLTSIIICFAICMCAIIVGTIVRETNEHNLWLHVYKKQHQ